MQCCMWLWYFIRRDRTYSESNDSSVSCTYLIWCILGHFHYLRWSEEVDRGRGVFWGDHQANCWLPLANSTAEETWSSYPSQQEVAVCPASGQDRQRGYSRGMGDWYFVVTLINIFCGYWMVQNLNSRTPSQVQTLITGAHYKNYSYGYFLYNNFELIKLLLVT